MFEFPVSLCSGTRGLRLSLPRVQVSHYMVSLVHSTSEEACHAYSLFSLFHLLYFFGAELRPSGPVFEIKKCPMHRVHDVIGMEIILGRSTL